MKNNIFIDTIDTLLPEEGETVTISGGLGHKTLSQRKQENGVFYKRDNEDDDWGEYDAKQEMECFIQSIKPEIKEAISMSTALNKRLIKRKKINSMLKDVPFIYWILITYVVIFNLFLMTYIGGMYMTV